MERRYKLTRIAAGDYLLPSNDGRTLLRITSYEDDGSASYVTDRGERRIVGARWNVWRFSGTMAEAERLLIDDPDVLLDSEWERWWLLVAGTMLTRRAAVDYALAHA